MSTTETTALVKLHGQAYLALGGNFNPAATAEVIRENTGGAGLSAFDLDRVHIPPGGSTTWTIPSIEGEKESKELEGVVIYWRDVRSFWKDPFTGAGTPPDCASIDSERGVGDPGGPCDQCPNAEFGSHPSGVGQACKQIRQLFLLTPDSLLPTVVALPPTSIQPVRKYFLGLVAKSLSYYEVVTRLTLEKTSNKGGIAYTRVVAQFVDVVGPDARPALISYRDAIKPQLSSHSFTDVSDAGDAPLD